VKGLLLEMSAFGIEIQEEAVCLFSEGVSKHDALTQLVESVCSTGAVSDASAFSKAVFERESVMSTGIGSGVAIPHVRIDEVRLPAVGVGVSRDGIGYDTLDNEPVYIVVLFAMPSGSQKQYLSLLAQVMLAMKRPDFTDELRACTTRKEVVDILNADGQ